MKIANPCPKCGGELDLVICGYIPRCLCQSCNTVFKVELNLTEFYTQKQSSTSAKAENEARLLPE